MHPTEYRAIPEELKKSKKLSILMPYLNEQDIIVKNTQEVISILKELKINYEIILIDDGSTDNSFELLKAEFGKDKKIKLIRNHQNFGKGWVIKTGFEYSTGDYILFLDSDLELSPYHIPNFLRVMEERNADAVIGSKLHEDSILDYPKARRFLSNSYYLMVKILFGLPIMDSQTGIKLFTREALEISLPRLLVKRWAFDIELLLILHKHKMKIAAAPIELKFSRGAFGKIRLNNIIQFFTDTMAIFFRDKILRFYERKLGENIRYHYTFILFQDRASDFEKDCLEKFLEINYEGYDVIVTGETDYGIKDPILRFVKSQSESYADRLTEVTALIKLKSDYVVLSTLNAYPDGRFFLSAGRVLSLPGVGAAGGFCVLRYGASSYETIVNSVSKSIFLNANLHYRYRAVTPKKVPELQLNGMIVKTEYAEKLKPGDHSGTNLELLLSRAVEKNKETLMYSPDLLLYRKFPDNYWEFVEGIENQVKVRVGRMFSDKSERRLKDYKFLISIGLLVFVTVGLLMAFVFRSTIFILPIFLYYGFLMVSRMLFFGLVNGFKSFLLLSWSQLFYGFTFLSEIAKRLLGPRIKKFLQRF